MKKKFDAVALMRKARERMAAEWEQIPRAEQIAYLRGKYGRLTARRVRRRAG